MASMGSVTGKGSKCMGLESFASVRYELNR